MKSNDFILTTFINGHAYRNFTLREFNDQNGQACIHPATVAALEYTRRDLNRSGYSGVIEIIVTGATRTQEQNEELGLRFGWADEGGIVARDSFHLLIYGGLAVDFYARERRTKHRLPQWIVGRVARKYFSWVRDNYSDGHVHGDMRALWRA